jgi:Protein of unknown function (DUF4238)
MSLSKRHHYNPRYYLKRFESDDGKIWRLDCEGGAIVCGNSDSFGFKKHWNTMRNPPEGFAADWAERRLSEIDGPASVVVARILAGDFPKDFQPLAYAISFMQNNQPRVMRELEEQHADLIQGWSDDFRLIIKTQSALDNGMSYLPLHYSVQEIDDNESSARFLTSSNPLIEFTYKPTMLLPLSNRHCLFMSNDPQHSAMQPKFLSCDEATVEEINKITIRNSWQYIYSCTPDFFA